jgi:hypothetical protein
MPGPGPRSASVPTSFDQLLSIRDVTDSVTSAVAAGATPTQAAEARAAAITGIQDRCKTTGANLNCQVVTMYRGGQYKLYTFRRYADVRLVFAPDGPAAFFGGDPDNFTFPRYDMDISFYRAYENGQSVKAAHHFAWSAKGSAEGDLIFVVGNPGSTGRLNTVAQMEYLRDVQYPATLAVFARQIPILHELANADAARARTLRNRIFGLENSQKATLGYRAGLIDPNLMVEAEVEGFPPRCRPTRPTRSQSSMRSGGTTASTPTVAAGHPRGPARACPGGLANRTASGWACSRGQQGTAECVPQRAPTR